MIFPARRILCSNLTVGVTHNFSNLLMICKWDSLKKKGVLNNSLLAWLFWVIFWCLLILPLPCWGCEYERTRPYVLFSVLTLVFRKAVSPLLTQLPPSLCDCLKEWHNKQLNWKLILNRFHNQLLNEQLKNMLKNPHSSDSERRSPERQNKRVWS